MNSQKVSTSLSIHLDAMRGLAALAVAFGHFRGFLLVDATHLQNPSPALKAFYFLTGYGHQAVTIFFVLSGFLISRSVNQLILENKWSWKKYSFNRLSRLLVVLIPALLLTAFWDNLGIRIFSSHPVYLAKSEWSNLISVPINDGNTFKTYLANLFFLQNIKYRTAGSNGALWSLSFEFWYYVLYPLLVLFFIRCTKWIIRVIYLFLFLFISYELRFSALPGFMIWLMGTLAISIPRFSIRNQTLRRSIGFIFILNFISQVLLSRITPNANEFVLGFSTALLLYYLRAHSTDIKENGYYSKVARFLSSFSYTLYLGHLPLTIFLCALLLKNGRMYPNLNGIVTFSIISILVIGYSYILYLLTEKNTTKIKHFLTKIRDKKLLLGRESEQPLTFGN